MIMIMIAKLCNIKIVVNRMQPFPVLSHKFALRYVSLPLLNTLFIIQRDEPYVPQWSKCFRYFTSFSVLVFFVSKHCLIEYLVNLFR